jgi:hypothetical protein
MKNIDDFDRLDQLLKAKSYNELSNEEKSWVDDKVGMNSYEELHGIIHKLQLDHEIKTKHTTKQALLSKMKAKHGRSGAFAWLNYKTPVFANLMILVAILSGFYFIQPTKEVIIEKPITVNVPVIDTLIIQSPPDTVYIEKRVLIEVPIYLTGNLAVPEKQDKEIPKKSFSEQKALQDLLVSGD